MNKKREELLNDLGIVFNKYTLSYRFQIGSAVDIFAHMIEDLEDNNLKQSLSMYLEKMRYEVFEFLAKQQAIINAYDLSETEAEKITRLAQELKANRKGK